MRKLVAALLLGAALTVSTVAAAQEYIMSPGDRLQIYVMGHADISSNNADADTAYRVRPDGKLDFPLIGEIDTTGMTIFDFTSTLKTRLSEYLVDPKVSVNVVALGTTRVFVLGEVKKQGLYELSKSHRVLDAIGAAGGFTEKSAKKNVFLIRDGREDNVEKLNVNALLRKGDTSQNVVLNEGDCLYFTSNHKFNFARDLFPFISTYYYIKRADD